jgi:cyclopropane fatty-acyl-phospholipid synthase-like methyltransferase
MGHSGAVPARIAWAIDLLHIQPEDRILEIGCGSGVALSLVADRLDGGRITAMDRSASAIERARARNAQHIAAGRAVLRQVELAKFRGRGPFDKAFAINVNVFWTTNADPECQVLTRVLGSDGGLWLVYEMPRAVSVRDPTNHVIANLARHGFTTEAINHPTGRLVCIVGKTRV